MAVSRSSRWAASCARFLYVEYFSISPGCFSPSFSSPDGTAWERGREAQSESQALKPPRAVSRALASVQAWGPVQNHPPLENSMAPGVFQGPLHPRPSSEHTKEKGQTPERQFAGHPGSKR